jgi:hypothetical protein
MSFRNLAARIGVYNSGTEKTAGGQRVSRTSLAAMRPKIRIAVSWLVAALGSFVGLFALAKFGMSWVPLGDHDPGWFLRWLAFAGVGLFGLGFLIASIIAPRNPRRAGIIFLVFLPITAFCLARVA